jgi:uncharacterized coiled-coil DUF342 family protein
MPIIDLSQKVDLTKEEMADFLKTAEELEQSALQLRARVADSKSRADALRFGRDQQVGDLRGFDQ